MFGFKQETMSVKSHVEFNLSQESCKLRPVVIIRVWQDSLDCWSSRYRIAVIDYHDRVSQEPDMVTSY